MPRSSATAARTRPTASRMSSLAAAHRVSSSVSRSIRAGCRPLAVAPWHHESCAFDLAHHRRQRHGAATRLAALRVQWAPGARTRKLGLSDSRAHARGRPGSSARPRLTKPLVHEHSAMVRVLRRPFVTEPTSVCHSVDGEQSGCLFAITRTSSPWEGEAPVTRRPTPPSHGPTQHSPLSSHCCEVRVS
jgi:hypothetical protein